MAKEKKATLEEVSDELAGRFEAVEDMIADLPERFRVSFTSATLPHVRIEVDRKPKNVWVIRASTSSDEPIRWSELGLEARLDLVRCVHEIPGQMVAARERARLRHIKELSDFDQSDFGKSLLAWANSAR